MKFMLVQSMILGKLAILMGVFTLIRAWLKPKGGLFSHNINTKEHHQDLSMQHYGYDGGEEYGAYVNQSKKKKKKRRRR